MTIYTGLHGLTKDKWFNGLPACEKIEGTGLIMLHPATDMKK